PVDRVQLPPPQVSGRRPAGIGRCPGDPAPLLELDDVVLPHTPARRRHHEHLTRAADALPVRRLGQVVVPVPPRLLNRIRDQLEDLGRLGRNLPTGTDDLRTLAVTGHSRIEPPLRPQRGG